MRDFKGTILHWRDASELEKELVKEELKEKGLLIFDGVMIVTGSVIIGRTIKTIKIQNRYDFRCSMDGYRLDRVPTAKELRKFDKMVSWGKDSYEALESLGLRYKY